MTLRARPGIVVLAMLLLAARAPGLVAPQIGHAARHGLSTKPLRDAVPGPRSQVPSREPESVRKSQPHPSAPIESLQFDGATSNHVISCNACDLVVSDRRYERAVGKWRDTWGEWRPAQTLTPVLVPTPPHEALPGDPAR